MSENECVCVCTAVCVRVYVGQDEWMYGGNILNFSFLILCENLFSTDFPGFKHCLLY